MVIFVFTFCRFFGIIITENFGRGGIITEKQLILRADHQTAASMLCRAASPDAALLYLYLVTNGGKATVTQASDGLKMPDKRILKAADTLLLYGIVSAEGTVPPKPAAEIPAQELVLRRDGDPEFSGLCSYLEGALGRILSRRELEILCTVHYDLGLQCDALMLMINDCRSRRRLSIREIEKLSYEWSDNGVTTYDRAAEYLEQTKEKYSRTSQVMGLFGLYNRRPSESEREFIEKWIALGFDNDMLKLAYERMIERIHEVSFPYLNAILERWAAMGVTTREKAEQERKRRAEQALIDAAAAAAPSDDALEAQVLEAFEKKRHAREMRQRRRLEDLMKKSEEFGSLESQLRLCSSQAARAAGDRREALLEQKEKLLALRTQKLQELGYSSDWLDNTPDCPLCGDRGIVGTNKCQCLKKAVAELKKS